MQACKPALTQGAIMLDTDNILFLAVALFYVALRVVGPIVVEEEELDLGGGISMTAEGHIRVVNAPPVAPMRIPEDSEIGILENATQSDHEVPWSSTLQDATRLQIHSAWPTLTLP